MKPITPSPAVKLPAFISGRSRTIGALMTTIALSGCPSGPQNRVVPPEPPDRCTSGCARLQVLGCTEILSELDEQNTGDCDRACRYVLSQGVSLNIQCWIDQAQTCKDIDTIC